MIVFFFWCRRSWVFFSIIVRIYWIGITSFEVGRVGIIKIGLIGELEGGNI